MISAVRLQQIITIGLLTYLYMAVLFMFQNSRYSTWDRYYRTMNNTLPDDLYVTNMSAKDYDQFDIWMPSNIDYNEYRANQKAIVEDFDNENAILTSTEPSLVIKSTTTHMLRKEFMYLRKNNNLMEYPVKKWIKNAHAQCSDQFTGYGNLFVHLKNAIIDPTLAIGRKGGEEIPDVLNQPEKDEYLKLKYGYFKLNCSRKIIHYKFNKKDHLNSWILNTRFSVGNSQKSGVAPNVSDKFTIAITRYEYVNMYHTMTDLYNAFLMLVIFQQEPSNVTVLWVDAHPRGGLDAVWHNLFGDVRRAGDLQQKTLYRNLVWGITGYFSPLNDHLRPTVPYLEEFRDFFLKQYNVADNKVLDCSALSILIIWRRDYIAHPRNPKGVVGRKIKNEKEIEISLRETFPAHHIRSEQMDILDMKDQLEIIANTDILIGMHGAGLSLSLFMPRHGALVELYPRYWSTRNIHFKAMASWRGLHYRKWQNLDRKLEFKNQLTHIPPERVLKMVEDVISKMCQV